MARSTRRGGGAGSGRDDAAAAASEADRIIDAAFAKISNDGWRRLSLAAVADAAELPILRVYRNFPSKQAILCGFFRRIDEAVLAEPPAPEEGEHPRDRLFDLIMRRLDALRPHKTAIEVLRRELPGDPPSLLVAGAALLRSMRWMHEAADIATGGSGCDCGKVNRRRLFRDASGMAPRRLARPRADDGGARCAVAPDRALADAGARIPAGR